MKKTFFATPQEAEAAFYDALQRGDLEAMMEVWSEDEEVNCIHPEGVRLTGYEQVRETWAQIFQSGQRLQISLSDQAVVAGVAYFLHCLHENVVVIAGPGAAAGMSSVVVTTNAYVQSAAGWRMVLHHASPAAAPVVRRELPAETAKVLH